MEITIKLNILTMLLSAFTLACVALGFFQMGRKYQHNNPDDTRGVVTTEE